MKMDLLLKKEMILQLATLGHSLDITLKASNLKKKI